MEEKKRSKKAMQIAISTLVIIILSVLILVGLLVFWNYQTGMFSDFLKSVQGETNIDSIVTACNTQVTQNSFHEYCCVGKSVKYEKGGKIVEEEMTCSELGDMDIGKRIQDLNCENAGC
jgi:uncharacterized protein YxeA